MSDSIGKAYAVIVAVKLSVITGDEVGSQYPDGPSRGRNIQALEGDSADILSKWGLLTTKTRNTSHITYMLQIIGYLQAVIVQNVIEYKCKLYS